MNDELNPKDTASRQQENLDKMIRGTDTKGMSRTRSQPREKPKKAGGGFLGFFIILLVFAMGALYFLTKNNVNIPVASELILKVEAKLLPVIQKLMVGDQAITSQSGSGATPLPSPAIIPPPAAIPTPEPSQDLAIQSSPPTTEAPNDHTEKKPASQPELLEALQPKTRQNTVQARPGYIDARLFLKITGLLRGSLQSQIAITNPHTPQITYPDQVITFRTSLYTSTEAHKTAEDISKGLGLKVIGIPVDDYDKGGASVFKATDSKTGLVYLAVKNARDTPETSWKLDYYRL